MKIMRTVFFILGGMSFFSSCNNSTAKEIDQIIFGIYCGHCIENCATMYQYIPEKSFLVDYSESYLRKGNFQFDTQLNDDFHFDIGDEIIKEIPKTLLNSTKESEVFGCPDCADGCGIYFEITKNGKKQVFNIDYQANQLEGEMKKFSEFLALKINQLQSKE